MAANKRKFCEKLKHKYTWVYMYICKYIYNKVNNFVLLVVAVRYLPTIQVHVYVPSRMCLWSAHCYRFISSSSFTLDISTHLCTYNCRTHPFGVVNSAYTHIFMRCFVFFFLIPTKTSFFFWNKLLFAELYSLVTAGSCHYASCMAQSKDFVHKYSRMQL